MRIIAYITCILVTYILFQASADFPNWGDPDSPASENVSPYYLENSMKDTEVPNVVSSVLADYRAFDTMWETIVVLVAAVAIIFLIRKSSYDTDYRPPETAITPHHNLIIITVCRILIPIMQIFAIYVLIHGHHSPGGGFQGGVILGAALILHSLAFGLQHTLNIMSDTKQRILRISGVLIFAGVGLLCLIAGGNFLDYAQLSDYLPLNASQTRSLAILLVESGVAMTVMSVMFSIYADLSSGGELDQGL